METKTGDQAIDDPEGYWEDCIGRALDALVAGAGLKKAASDRSVTEEVYAERLGLRKNCGTGAGGSQSGSTCARGDGGTPEEKASLKMSRAADLPEERTRAPKDLSEEL